MAYVPQGLALAYYELDTTSWVSEVITTTGLHYLKVNRPEHCLQTTRVLLEQAHQAGLMLARLDTAWPAPVYLCAVGSPTGDLVSIVAARQGEFLAIRSPRGGAPTETVGTLTTVADAMDYLMHPKVQEPYGRT